MDTNMNELIVLRHKYFLYSGKIFSKKWGVDVAISRKMNFVILNICEAVYVHFWHNSSILCYCILLITHGSNLPSGSNWCLFYVKCYAILDQKVKGRPQYPVDPRKNFGISCSLKALPVLLKRDLVTF